MKFGDFEVKIDRQKEIDKLKQSKLMDANVLMLMPNIDMKFIKENKLDVISSKISNNAAATFKGKTTPIDKVTNAGMGIYAWVVNGVIVYIGQAKNFKTRMKQHMAGLTQKLKTKKYNSDIDVKDVFVGIVYETAIEEHLSVAEQMAINCCGGSDNLLNGRNELTKEKYIRKLGKLNL